MGLAGNRAQAMFTTITDTENMRINIKTNSIVRDKDVRALYMIDAAIKQSTPRMREANLQFIADRYGLRIEPKYAAFLK